MQQVGQRGEVLGRVPEIQDHDQVTREVRLQEVLEAVAPIGQADPEGGVVHAYLRRLPAQLQSQRGQVVQPGQVTDLHPRPRRGLVRGRRQQFRHRVVDHAYVGHAALGLGAVGSLLPHAGRVGADLSTGASLGIPVPGPGLGESQRLPRCEELP